MLLAALQAQADTTYHVLANGAFGQDWSNVNLITTNDIWTSVPSLEGYRGDNPAVGTGVDPQTVVAFVSSPLNVWANVADASNFSSGGVAEIDAGADIAGNPTIAFQGSGTADAPFVLLRLDTTGCTSLQLSYKLRDVDTLETATAQPVVVQSRVGESGNFANVPGTFVAAANNGGVTNGNVNLPVGLENQAQVQLRWLTTNAVNVDAMIGIDDIAVTGSCTGGVDNPPSITATVPLNGAGNVNESANLSVQFSEPVTTDPGWFALTCGGNPVTVAQSGTGALRTLDPDSFLPSGASCAATIDGTKVFDQDGTIDALGGTTVISFTVITDNAPTIASTVPASNASNVGVSSNISITFSEPVTASGSWFGINCSASGAHPAVATGGPTTFTLNPNTNFELLETCTVTLMPVLITDQDGAPTVLSGTTSFQFMTTGGAATYYNGIDASSAAALRTGLHNLIDDHTAYPYSAGTTDTWDILDLADQNPANSNNILDVYKNASYPKVGAGNSNYNREHTWPNSYGFNDLDGLDNQGRPYSPFTDCHMLYLSHIQYNTDRNNKAYGNCTSCAENPTDVNNGQGGGTGVYPGNSNWYSSGVEGGQGSYEVWHKRRGDIARAVLYMDIRYEGGNATNGQAEPDLRLTNDRGLIQGTASGSVAAIAYMGVLDTLLAWHASDPPDANELLRNEVVFSFQGNRNPFIDHPDYAACLFQTPCTPALDEIFDNGFEDTP